jgi:uroporphyrinogen-III synthase
VKRLGLARGLEHRLSLAVSAAGWQPVFLPFVVSVPTEEPPPAELATADAVLVLSPGGGAVAAPHLPPGMRVLCQGAGTFEAMGAAAPHCAIANSPRAEGLWDLLRQEFPAGGRFVLVRGERTRGYLEALAQGSSWRITPWITHREAPADPMPSLDGLDGVLALSPLQAEILAPLAGDLLRFAWGSRTREAFLLERRIAHAACEPKPEALTQMLSTFLEETRP